MYGLMVYLPAYSVPPAAERGAIRPRAHHAALAYFVPLACQIPAAAVVALSKGWLGVQLFTDKGGSAPAVP